MSPPSWAALAPGPVAALGSPPHTHKGRKPRPCPPASRWLPGALGDDPRPGGVHGHGVGGGHWGWLLSADCASLPSPLSSLEAPSLLLHPACMPPGSQSPTGKGAQLWGSPPHPPPRPPRCVFKSRSSPPRTLSLVPLRRRGREDNPCLHEVRASREHLILARFLAGTFRRSPRRVGRRGGPSRPVVGGDGRPVAAPLWMRWPGPA